MPAYHNPQRTTHAWVYTFTILFTISPIFLVSSSINPSYDMDFTMYKSIPMFLIFIMLSLQRVLFELIIWTAHYLISISKNITFLLFPLHGAISFTSPPHTPSLLLILVNNYIWFYLGHWCLETMGKSLTLLKELSICNLRFF